MTITPHLISFAKTVRQNRAANVGKRGDGTGLELLIAPTFQSLLQAIADEHFADVRVLPEYRRTGMGRPDIAISVANMVPRAFVELKAPEKGILPDQLRGHDLDQFKRFQELPHWALSNFSAIRCYERDTLETEAVVVPPEALDPETSDAAAQRMIEQHDHSGFMSILHRLVTAEPPVARNAPDVAVVLAHAARLVREVVLAQCEAGLDDVNGRVRAMFNNTLFARAEAGGHDVRNTDRLFASAFAQTLIFGLLLARDVANSGREEKDENPPTDIDGEAYRLLPEQQYSLLRGTLRALSQDEVRDMLGVAFDIAIDTVNSVAPELLKPTEKRDPVLYLYEDFLRVFDSKAVAKYGVYYTPPEVVRMIVALTDQALREELGTDGLVDEQVRLLDPACGTGTFMLGAAEDVADRILDERGEAAVGPHVASLVERMFGFELLVGPYAVAHYRMAREVLRRGGTLPETVPIFLTDTLAPPAGEKRVVPQLGFMSAPIVQEREAADRVKSTEPLLAIIGNPPYKRLKKGEIERLVGPTMDDLWQDLKKPVQEAGLGRSLNAFPDLCIAFYRWAIWRLFEASGAPGRGVVAFITNRTFLISPGYGGLRKMLRERFDTLRVIDLRGNNRGALPATVMTDENVFNIEVGVCVLIASTSDREDEESRDADVFYADAWRNDSFTRAEKLTFADRSADDLDRLDYITVPSNGMDRFKPKGFRDHDWISVDEVFEFSSNGIVTYRDKFVYAINRTGLEERLMAWSQMDFKAARGTFSDSAGNSADVSHALPIDPTRIRASAYRPLDRRFLYAHPNFVDRLRPELTEKFGANNLVLMTKNDGIGRGPAVWCHGSLPDQHSFRGSTGGWMYPLWDHSEAQSHFINPNVMAGLAAAYGRAVEPQAIFDATLALLSAPSYTVEFAHDLEDDFPHVPFPAAVETFERAAALGGRIRMLEAYQAPPEREHCEARIEGAQEDAVLAVPTPSRAFAGDQGSGSVSLTADGAIRIVNVSERAWGFKVSGYQLLYKWLKARDGEALTGASARRLIDEMLDMVWRLEALIACFDEADPLLQEALQLTLTRDQVNLRPDNEQ